MNLSETNTKSVSLPSIIYIEGNLRNYVLIIMAVHTALRISDLLRLCWEDVYDFEHKRIRASITIVEKKTGKTKTIALNKNIVKALSNYARKAANKAGSLLKTAGQKGYQTYPSLQDYQGRC